MDCRGRRVAASSPSLPLPFVWQSSNARAEGDIAPQNSSRCIAEGLPAGRAAPFLKNTRVIDRRGILPQAPDERELQSSWCEAGPELTLHRLGQIKRDPVRALAMGMVNQNSLSCANSGKAR
jgi:hypothetical protein